MSGHPIAADSYIADLEAERDALREALRGAHGIAQQMADLDGWIAEQCGMKYEEDTGDYYIPSARAALAQPTEVERLRKALLTGACPACRHSINSHDFAEIPTCATCDCEWAAQPTEGQERCPTCGRPRWFAKPFGEVRCPDPWHTEGQERE